MRMRLYFRNFADSTMKSYLRFIRAGGKTFVFVEGRGFRAGNKVEVGSMMNRASGWLLTNSVDEVPFGRFI
jgi:hypothetical protein